MNPFLVVVDLGGATLGLDALTPGLPALSQSDGRVEVLWNGPWAGAWVPSRHFARPAFIHQHGIFAIGNVRLSGRSNRRTDVDRVTADLAFIIDEYRRLGPLAVRNLAGDFSFVLWDSQRRQLLAARDAFGVKTLYWRHEGQRLYLASHIDCFDPAEYDRDFIGHFLIGQPNATTRTIYRGINRLTAGNVLTTDGDRVTTQPYWRATEFVSRQQSIDPTEAAIEWRRLFSEAVTAQLDDGIPAWAQLSGGLDSSSVVSMAATLANQGRVPRLKGTLSIVDSLSEGDERRYSNAVLAMHPHANTTLTDYWAWQPDDHGPKESAEPRGVLPFYARNRAMNEVVIKDGGRVILSGFGSDQYLSGPHLYIAELVTRGRMAEAGRLLIDLAVGSRRSFYQAAFNNVIKPLAPKWLRRRWGNASTTLTPWIDRSFAKELDLAERLAFPGDESLDVGPFAAAQANEIGTIDLALERGVSELGVELRYPFLHRPLVEFTLTLSPSMRMAPNRPKWILRESLDDLLPPLVRDRTGKGGIDGRIIWSLTKEHELLQRLIDGSRLVDMRCVDGDGFRAAFAAARAGNVWSVSPVFTALAMETWFAAQSGKWQQSVPVPAAATAAVHLSTQGVQHVELH